MPFQRQGLLRPGTSRGDASPMVMSSSTPTAADGSSSTATSDLGAVAHEHGGTGSGAHAEFAEHPVPPSREILDAAGELLRALAAPVRIAIVLQLRESARCVHELVDALAVPQPLVSQHLRILKSAGVVAGKRWGREVMYRLVDHHMTDIVVAAVTHAAEGSE